MSRRLTGAQAVLAALLVSCLVLVAVELAKGAASEPPPKLANPCRPRDVQVSGFDATVQRIVLDGLDGAACRLHTTREELVLSLDPQTGVRRWDERTIERALRAGLLRAVDEAERRGDIPGFATPLLRRLVESAPIDQLIRGGIGLQDLLGSL
jgi:hypothetical protein